jgi:hypothetical protein
MIVDYLIIGIPGVHDPTQSKLLGVAQAIDHLGLVLRPRQGRKQQGGKNGYNRDDNQQFDKGESPYLPAGSRLKSYKKVTQLRIELGFARLKAQWHKF